MNVTFFAKSNTGLYFIEVTAGAWVIDGGYVAQPASTATKARGAAMGFVTDSDIVSAKGMKSHVVKTGWMVTRCIPLCQYRREIVSARAARIAEIQEKAEREKLIQVMKALVFVAAVACPLLRVGTSIWKFAEAVELAESLDLITKVTESVLVNKRETVFDVLYDVVEDMAKSSMKKGMVLGGLVCLYPTMSKRMIKFSDKAYDIWDARPDAAKVDTASALPYYPEDDILDDIYRFRMGADPKYSSQMVAAAPKFEDAWKAAQSTGKAKAGPGSLLQPKVDLTVLSRNYWPDCECTYCGEWQKAMEALKQDFASKRAQYIQETR
ncbi:MAG: hypothetical protein JNK87_37405 [Bryobacterales bacterium]|nr:hypothetical protein [Bryobacterales bacterium]